MEGTIPVIDISALVKNTPEKYNVAKEIDAACRKYGFFYITGHGIDPRLEQSLENQSRRFFALPMEEKQKINMKLGGKAWRGFRSLCDELASGKPNMKEGLYLGLELEPNHPLVKAETPFHGPNLFPENIPGFKETILEWISQITHLGHKLMGGIALGLDLPEDYFKEIFSPEPLPLFRIFNYPAQDAAEVEERVTWGVAPHTDYGVLTILKQDHLGGLEVKSQGEWIPAPPIPGTFVCNIGDMLERVTGGMYRSNLHRVRSPTNNQDRMSFALFFDPNYHAHVKPIEKFKGFIGEDKDSSLDGMSIHSFEGTFGDYLTKKYSVVFSEFGKTVLLENEGK